MIKCEKCGRLSYRRTQLTGWSSTPGERGRGRIEAESTWCIGCCLSAISAHANARKEAKMTRAEQALQGLSDYKLNFFILPEDPIPLMRWVTSECGYGAVVEIDSLRAKRLLRYVAQQLAEWILKGLEEVSP